MDIGKNILLKILSFFLLISSSTFSQKKIIKKFTTNTQEIAIFTKGLDDLVLENSTSKFIEILLYAEDPNKQHIVIEEKSTETEIKFKIPVFKSEDAVFRKYITKRLKRASVTIKIPKNKEVSIFGEHINISSKSYNGNLNILIEKGIVKVDTIQQNLVLKMYEGNLFGVLKQSNLTIVSKIGEIKIDTVFHKKKYKENRMDSGKEIAITTIKGNIFLTHQ
jgi:hypothetical protein